MGGEGTVYENLSYKLSLSFPGRYPYNPPVIKFVTPIFHPNVDENGNICLDILKVLLQLFEVVICYILRKNGQLYTMLEQYFCQYKVY